MTAPLELVDVEQVAPLELVDVEKVERAPFLEEELP